MKGSYVGILLNQSMYRGIPAGKTQTEVLSYYEEGARLYGLKPCYIRLDDLHLHRDKVMAFVKEGSSYQRMEVPVPRVIHNRALLFSAHDRNKLTQLAERKCIIFNRWNRYSKPYIHSLLWAEPSFRPHMAQTVSGTPDNIRKMMKAHRALFIKPNSGSIGVGIMRLVRASGGWRLSYAVREEGRKRWKHTRFTGALPAHLLRKLQTRRFHIQEELPLATFRGRRFDLRVTVQKDATGEWQVAGMVGKVAPSGRFLSNVGQGGKVYRLAVLLEEYPDLQTGRVKQAVEAFALRVARHLETVLPELADIGLDIGLTREGKPLFIECNGRDQRYAFGHVRMMEEWKATYANPMGYARYLLDRMNAEYEEGSTE
ncbi:YheC/YheD family protein [Aneurinibacillus sp. BA2021]|nr:YheC/YheD family protein [Aneurinibacillus sp. BA2021]